MSRWSRRRITSPAMVSTEYAASSCGLSLWPWPRQSRPDHAESRAGQCLLPSSADPVQPVVGRKPVHRDKRRATFGSIDLVVQANSIAVEIHGGGTYASRSV